jgi:hypothetical protein
MLYVYAKNEQSDLTPAQLMIGVSVATLRVASHKPRAVVAALQRSAACPS